MVQLARQRIREKVLQSIIGSHWRTFIATSFSKSTALSDHVFQELSWEYSTHEEGLTLAERTVFGSEQSIRYELEDLDVTIRLTSVSYDPVTNFALNHGGSSSTKEKYSDNISIIDIQNISDEEEALVREFLRELSSKIDHPPWQCNHPRFRYSPLLRYKVKLLWEYWTESY